MPLLDPISKRPAESFREWRERLRGAPPSVRPVIVVAERPRLFHGVPILGEGSLYSKALEERYSITSVYKEPCK